MPLLVRSRYVPEALAVRMLATLALLVAVARPGLGQPATTAVSSPSLLITFADGRVTTHPIRRSGEMWTPLFPRLAGPVPARDGRPLSALGVSYQSEGDVVVATVSLIYGLPHRTRVKVATVTVTAAPAVVNELRAYGVQPVTLSLAAIVEGALRTPEISSVSKALRVTVTPLPPGASRYRFAIANDSSRTLEAFRFEAYRGTAIALSGCDGACGANRCSGPAPPMRSN